MNDPILTKSPQTRKLLTTPTALAIARQACVALLYGEPEPVTFEREDLIQAVALLGQMLATLEEVRP